jgi:hypothetical protein
MAKIKLLPERLQAGRICTLIYDTYVDSRLGEIMLPGGTLVVMLPSPRIRAGEQEHLNIIVYVCPKSEQPVEIQDLFREVVGIPGERLKPTEYVFTHVNDLDWVARTAIFENFGLSETYISNLCDVHGEAEAFSKLRFFNRLYRNHMKIPCRCGKMLSVFVFTDDKEQSIECKWCGSYFRLPTRSEREELITKQIYGEVDENTDRSEEQHRRIV